MYAKRQFITKSWIGFDYYLPYKVLFRWDAKADNQFGHSFRQGFRAKAHPTFTFLIVLLAIPFIDWRSLISEDTPFVPKIVRVSFSTLSIYNLDF